MIRALKKYFAGSLHTLIHKEDGSVWGMGYNYYGQLGNGRTDIIQKTPVKIFDKGIKNIVARGYHTMVLKNEGYGQSVDWLTIDNNRGILTPGKNSP